MSTYTVGGVRRWRLTGLPVIAGGDVPPTVEDLEARQEEIKQRTREIDAEHAGAQLGDEARDEWNTLNAEHDRNVKTIEELRAREERLRLLSTEPTSTEVPTFTAPPSGRTRDDAIWDVTTVRTMSPEAQGREYRDRVKRAVEQSHFPHPGVPQERAQSHVIGLLERFGSDDDSDELVRFARRLLQTGSPTYRRAFAKHVAGQGLTTEEQRALSLTASAGGYAVPYTLDPTIVPTSNGTVNPWRAIARVIPITTDEWRGVTAGAVTAAYAAEGTEASDNAPTLAQPVISAERAQAFIPFSIEIGQDWSGLQAEMAVLLQEAKDDLEAAKFLTGGGTNEPFGLLTGLSNTVRVQTAATATFAVGDLYALEAALPPRYRSRASLAMNRAIIQRVRQFDTQGGSNMVMRLNQGIPTNLIGGGTNLELLGYPAYEASAAGSVLTSGTKIAILGDFRHFVIVERIGMSIEVIPHLFGASNRFPTGQRGLYAFWRNSSKVIAENAFRFLETL